MAKAYGVMFVALVLIMLHAADFIRASTCSSYHDVDVCKGMLDSMTSADTKECDLAETCLKGLSCCCSPDMPFQERIRCSARRRDIGYAIFRLSYICKRIVAQQPNSPTC